MRRGMIYLCLFWMAIFATASYAAKQSTKKQKTSKVTAKKATAKAQTPPAADQLLYGRAGCGLGSVLFGPTGNQSSASTTNNSSGTQLFGITSGTSNCVADGSKWSAIGNQHQFVANNLHSLSKEIAQGSGNALQGFSQTFGCPTTTYPLFAKQLQQAYREIFAQPGVEGVLDTTIRVLHDNPALVKQCQNLFDV